MEAIFTGVCTALPTPFRGGRVDVEALRRLTERQLQAGVRALLAGGTTGEASTLTMDEWEKTVACVSETAAGRAVILAGTGSNDPQHTLRRARIAARLNVSAQLVVTPYYNKTTQKGLTAYYTRVAEENGPPVILYNVPGRTGLNMLPETVARLAEHPRIAGIKEASGNLNQIAALLRLCSLPVYCGSDELNAPAMQLGAAGVISVVSNLWPDAAVRLCAAEAREANRLQEDMMPLIRALFAETSPAPLKAGLNLLALCESEVRPPLVPVEPETLRALREALAREEMQ